MDEHGSAIKVAKSRFISKRDFRAAIEELQQEWAREERQDDRNGWQDVRVVTSPLTEPFLRISRIIVTAASIGHVLALHDESEPTDDNNDQEVLHSTSSAPERARVAYDVVWSPSYQVPVLYLSMNPNHMSRDRIYDLLVPGQHRSQVEGVGIMGALSMTDHPISGLPVYFVHPCRTAEAMAQVLGAREHELGAEEYLMLWLGLVGPSVGLNVPVELAKAMREHLRLK